VWTECHTVNVLVLCNKVYVFVALQKPDRFDGLDNTVAELLLRQGLHRKYDVKD